MGAGSKEVFRNVLATMDDRLVEDGWLSKDKPGKCIEDMCIVIGKSALKTVIICTRYADQMSTRAL